MSWLVAKDGFINVFRFLIPRKDRNDFWIPWSLHEDRSLKFSHNNYEKFTFAKAPRESDLYYRLTDVLFSQNPNGQKLLKNLACEFPEQEAHFYSCLIVELKRLIARNKGNLRLVGMAEEYIKFAEEQLKQIDVRDQSLIEIELKEIELNKREAELKAREIELENRERSLFEDGVMNGFEQGTINKTLKQDFYIYCLTPVVLGWIKVTAEGGHTAYIKKFCKFFNFDVKDNPLSNYGHASKSEKAYLGYANQLRDKFRKGEHYIESKEDDTCF